MRAVARDAKHAEEPVHKRDRGGLAASHGVLALQRLVGNAAVSRAVADGLFGRGAAAGARDASSVPSRLDAGRGAGHALQRTVEPVLQRTKGEGAPGQRPDLVLGDSGPGVTVLQRMVGVAQTGTFDQQTRSAVDRFQRQQGWEPSGVGPETWRRLDNHAGSPGHRPNLVEGDRGPGVRLLQAILGLTETYFFGPATRQAVDVFQRSQGWEPSGVGPETWKRLDASAIPVGSSCRVKSFSMKVKEWDIFWPVNAEADWTTVRLPVSFLLELEAGSSKSGCFIFQRMKGLTEMGQHKDPNVDKCEAKNQVEEFSTFVRDGPLWWDGKAWYGGGRNPSWSSKGDIAEFEDNPGFPVLRRECYPIYWGGVGRNGNFEFQTVVSNIAGTPVATLEWGMLIDYSRPRVGRRSHS